MESKHNPIIISGRCYEFIKKIGAGTFGEAHLVQDERAQEYVVKTLKILPSPSQIAAFKNEFLLLTQLKHPHLCATHDFIYSESLRSYLFLSDYAPGKSFFEATQSQSAEDIERLAIQMLDVLDYLHQHGVIHFDIKCSNIIVQKDKTVKLLDFGLAQLEKFPLENFPGSLRYSAPELLLKSRSTDHRADLYSFGIVLFRALTRRFPFEQSDVSEMLDWHLHQNIVWEESECRNIPAHLRRLVEFLLKKSPAERLSQAQAAINWINLHTENKYGSSLVRRTETASSEGRLLGRSHETALAREIFAAARSSLAVFTGDRGIGKSRLLKEIKYEAEVKEFSCLWFDRFSQKDGISQLMEQLQLATSHSPDQFFQTSFEKISERAPVALFIDDWQDADPFFWEWTARLHGQRMPVILFASWEGSPPTHGPLVPLFRQEKIVPLEPLTREDLKTYIAETLNVLEIPKGWLQSLHDFSAGIPLLVVEGLRYLLEGVQVTNGSPRGSSHALKLPESIERLYENSLLALSADALQILQTLALWKKPVSLEALSDSIPMPLPRMMPLIPHLLAKGLLARSSFLNPLETGYLIPHTALALVLQNMSSPETKKKRFQNILDILTRLEAEPHPSVEELASYAVQADDSPKACRYLLQLAEHYASSFQTQKAADTYQQLLLWGKGDAELFSKVRKKLIPLLVLSGTPEKALDLFPQGERLGPPDRKLKGWALTRCGRFQEAAKLYQEGLEEIAEGDPLYSELLNDVANIHVQTREIAKALHLFRQTLPPAGATPEEKFKMLKNNNLGLALALSGHIDEARQFEKDKWELAQTVGDQHQIAAALSQLGFIELQGHNLSQAASYFEESLSLSETSGDLHNILILLDNLILIFQQRGLYHEALRYFAKAVNYRSAVSPPYQILQNYLKGAFLYLTIGLPEPARAYLKKIDSLLPEVNSPALTGWALLAWGYYQRAVGNLEESSKMFQDAANLADQEKEDSLSAWGHYALADLRLEQKKFVPAARECAIASWKILKSFDEDLTLRIKLLHLLMQKDGFLPREDNPEEGLNRLAEECEAKGMLEIAAEAYSAAGHRRGQEIYLEIASRLPEEYKMAYQSDRLRNRVNRIGE